MRVLYLSRGDPRDVMTWSGTARGILRSFERLGHSVDVQIVAPSWVARKWVGLQDKLAFGLMRKHYDGDTDSVARAIFRRQTMHQAAGKEFDLVFSWHPFAAECVASSKPLVTWYDTTYRRTLEMYYPDLTASSARRGIEMEEAALRRCSAAIYPSEWAARCAREDNPGIGGKVHVIPFGANMDVTPGWETVRQSVEARLARPAREMKLLFVGVDWNRKGGPAAVAAVEELRRRGWNASLTVVGSPAPGLTEAQNGFVKRRGVLDKRKAEDVAELSRLYLESDFFLLPSRGESYGIVYCEAIAHGCPCLAADVGGVGTIVRSGVTGEVFPRTEDMGQRIAARAEEIRGDAAGYRELCEKAFAAFQADFNWEIAAQRLGEVLAKV
jgi:glycosyltransferase involved in cell wall biosynthesis